MYITEKEWNRKTNRSSIYIIAKVIILFTQPLCSGRILHKVNF